MDTDNTRLTANVLLQGLNERKQYTRVGEVTLDATEILALPAAHVRDLIRDFDDGSAPYLERLPVREADALSAVHGGPTEVSLNITEYLVYDLQVIGDADSSDPSWLTDEVLERARDKIGFVPPVETDGHIFEINGRFLAAGFDGKAWQHRGDYDTLEDAEMNLGLQQGPKP